MVADNIDGTAIAKAIRSRINEQIRRKQEVTPRFNPSLTIVQGNYTFIVLRRVVLTGVRRLVGARSDSSEYMVQSYLLVDDRCN